MRERNGAARAAVWMALIAAVSSSAWEARGEMLEFESRRRVETTPGSGVWVPELETLRWDGAKTAAVVCDMWDKHWCDGATGRVGEMAPRMNQVLSALRDRGVLIIHCPSQTLDFYKDSPQRALAMAAPKIETAIPLQNWCNLDTNREAGLPIDDSDGGCDCCPGQAQQSVWTRQIAAIDIEEGDAITDSAEAYYLMRQRGITNVIVMGVHTNMCVLGRPFSIRQMNYQGQNVLLMRDMTDTMYNPAMRPWVSHFTGTDYVVEHIERHWCPTVTSDQVIGGEPLRFADDSRKRLVMLIAEEEYKTERTLQEFGRKFLGNDFAVDVIYDAPKEGRDDLRGIEKALAGADVLLVSARRRSPSPEQLAAIRKYVESGKPVVGIRTASHAFSLRGAAPPAGLATWEEWDAQMFGGSYTNHWGDGEVSVGGAGATGHPLLRGVALPFDAGSSLYRVAPLGDKAVPLLMGHFADKPAEPVAWTNENYWGGRVFYTSLGHEKDFENPSFERLLLNGIDWAAGMD